MLTQKDIQELFAYDPKTGFVTRLKKTANRHKVGERVGTPGGRGYLQVTIGRKKCPLHRVIWCLVYGVWPVGDVDHRNRIRSDNRLTNLREASRSENNHNASPNRRNTSGARGVCWDKSRGKWTVHIHADGKQHHLGRFDELDKARDAYLSAKALYHPTSLLGANK